MQIVVRNDEKIDLIVFKKRDGYQRRSKHFVFNHCFLSLSNFEKKKKRKNRNRGDW